MADELTIAMSFKYDDGSASVLALVASLLPDVSTKKHIHTIQSIGTSEEALALGEVSSLGWAFFKNLDATNYIEIRTGTGGTKIAKLLAGEVACFRFGSGITAPYAIADTAACLLEYAIVST